VSAEHGEGAVRGEEPVVEVRRVDRDIGLPLSNALNGLPSAQHIFASSSQSFSTIQVQFSIDSRVKDDLDAVNQRLAQVQLPAGAGKPLAQTFSFSAAPSITYSLAAQDGDLSRATAEARAVIAPTLQGAAREAGDALATALKGAHKRIEAAGVMLVGITCDSTEQQIAYAKEKGLPAEMAELAKSDEVREMVQVELDRANSNYAKVEQVKRFTILDHDLSIESGELTPTLKVKRNVINDRYAELFDELYS